MRNPRKMMIAMFIICGSVISECNTPNQVFLSTCYYFGVNPNIQLSTEFIPIQLTADIHRNRSDHSFFLPAGLYGKNNSLREEDRSEIERKGRVYVWIVCNN